MSSGVRPADLMASAHASVARVAVVSFGPAMRRSLMPVRSVIHSSVVSSRACRFHYRSHRSLEDLAALHLDEMLAIGHGLRGRRVATTATGDVQDVGR